MTTNTWARCATRYDLVGGGDADLDRDREAWHAPAGPVARVGLLGGVHVRAPGRAPRRPAGALVVLEVLALRPQGTTTRQLLQAPSPRGAEVTAGGLPELLAGLADWLGRDPAGRDRLRCARLPTGEGVYRLADVLVDIDLFRRLRLRGAARGPAGAADLRAARELLPQTWLAHLAGGGEAGGVAPSLCAAAADLTRRLGSQAALRSSAGAGDGGPSVGVGRVPQPAAGQPGFADAKDVCGSEASPEPDDGSGNGRVWRPGSRCPGVFLLPQLGQPRPGQCVRHGGDVDATGALLTLADLERHLLKGAPAPVPDVTAAPGRATAACSPPPPGRTPPPLDGEQVAGPALHTARPDRPHWAVTDVATDLGRAAPPAASPGRHHGDDRLVARTPHPPTAAAAANVPQPAASPSGPTAAVTVLAAHGGAGASTVALALADAAAARGLAVHLVAAAAVGGGLEGAANAELGEDLTAGWRTGRRGRQVTIHHDLTRLGGRPRQPTLPGRGGGLVVLDLGLGATNAADGTVGDPGLLVVLVARASVPGLRAAELLLGALPAADEAPGAPRRVLVTVGPARWPGVVAASAGPGVRAMREHDRWVPVPLDRALACTGLSSRALPQAVLHAARAVLRHLPPAAPGGPGAEGASPAAVGGQR